MTEPEPRKCVQLHIQGRVTGVGYRWWFQQQAQAAHLTGYVRNVGEREVEAYLCGPADRVDQLVERAAVGPPAARPTSVRAVPAPERDLGGFRVFG